MHCFNLIRVERRGVPTSDQVISSQQDHLKTSPVEPDQHYLYDKAQIIGHIHS